MVRSEETHLCPSCQKKTLHAIGRRIRSVINSEGNRERYLIRRLQCPLCKRIHHELPNFIVPYKRYAAQVVEAAIDGKTHDLPCYDSTIKNFKCWFAHIADKMACFLEKTVLNKVVKQESVSPLQRIKLLYGGSYGWLAWAIGIVVGQKNWLEITRLLC